MKGGGEGGMFEMRPLKLNAIQHILVKKQEDDLNDKYK